MVCFVRVPVAVTAPATSANLGPGFDALGIALTMADRVEAEVTGTDLRVQLSGEGADKLPRDDSNLVVRAMQAVFDQLAVRPSGLRLSCHSMVPQGRGLGSSAAAIVAGILAARSLIEDGVELLDDAAVLALAARLEGHPDNVAACLLGGLTVAWTTDAGARAVRMDAHIDAVLFVAPRELATSASRSLLPDTVSHHDAVRNVGRVALLVATLVGPSRARENLLAATQDWLHQPYRANVMPDSLALVDKLRTSGVPAVVSGSGPSVLALLSDEDNVAVVRDAAPAGWGVHHVSSNPDGARVEFKEAE